MRIRTIKPEFWTDSVIVRLPFHARLFFVGLWNMADDWGALGDEPDRLKMELFPNDDVDPYATLDLLCDSGLISRYEDEKGGRIILIHNFVKHQKIDKRSAKRYSGGGKWKKSCVPTEVRAHIARAFNCKPNESVKCDCYYCGQPSTIAWTKRGSGIGWITFGCLELDHFVPEIDGGFSDKSNIVLACRLCNRQKGCYEHGYSFLSGKLTRDGPLLSDEYEDIDKMVDVFIGENRRVPVRREVILPAESRRIPPNPAESHQETGMERKGREGKGKESKEESIAAGAPRSRKPRPEPIDPATVEIPAHLQKYSEDLRNFASYRAEDKREPFTARAWAAFLKTVSDADRERYLIPPLIAKAIGAGWKTLYVRPGDPQRPETDEDRGLQVLKQVGS